MSAQASGSSKLRDIEDALAGDLAGLTRFERKQVRRVIQELMADGKSVTMDAIWGRDFNERPVSIEKFMDDPYYLGNFTKDLYPAVRKGLIKAFDPQRDIQEVILGGSIGWGKTTLAAVGITYLAYIISCLKDPHAYYRIMPGSKIVLGVYSVTKTQSSDTSFAKIMSYVDGSPYFRQKCPRSVHIKSKLVFPSAKFQIITGSQELHAIGNDLFGALIDEANFLRGKSRKETGDSMAETLYQATKQRIKSRFMQKGGMTPGMVFVVSSKKTHRSFLEAHIASVRKEIEEGSVLLLEHSQWSAKPNGTFTMPKFRVEIGDQINPSRVLLDDMAPRPGAEIIQVPGEFRIEFERDVDAALRDLAGIATFGVSPLFYDRQAVLDCVTERFTHPFTRDEVIVTERSGTTLDDYFQPEAMFNVRMSRYALRHDPHTLRYVHMDLSKTGDCTGIACVHVSGMKELRRMRPDGTHYIDACPMLAMDFCVRIKPQRASGEIDLSKIRSFIISLRDMGLPIQVVSCDGFASADMVQLLRKIGFESVYVSVDRNDLQYLTLRQAMLEGRMEMYRYEPLLQELYALERDLDRKVVDHPQEGSKDCADALAGAMFICMNDKRALDGTGRFVTALRERVGESTAITVTAARGATVKWDRVAADVSRELRVARRR